MLQRYNNKSILIIILVISIFLVGCSKNIEPAATATPYVTEAPTAEPTAEPTPEPTAVPQPIEIILGGTGDIMVHEKQLDDARYTARFVEGYTYYFEHNFRYISPALHYPDLMFGNLETVFGSKALEYSGWPYFNTPDEFAVTLKNAGFDILTTANNHALDRGREGLLRTLSILDENGFYHTGTFDSQQSYDTPLIIDVKGIKIGVLASAYAYQNLGKLEDDEQTYMLSVSSEEYLKAEVEDLKNAGAQIIVASMHWGDEKAYERSDSQMQYAEVLIKSGVDVIFGHHPHVLQPIEYVEVTLDDGTTNSAVVCWSLGNFIANSYYRLEQEGAICYVYLSFDPVTEDVTITKTQVLPTYIYNEYTYYFDYHVLPSGTPLEVLNINDFPVPDNFASTLNKKFFDVMDNITDSYVEFIYQVP